MRIISGSFKGRRFDPPSGLQVRPTTDFAREGLFNLLNNIIDFEGLEVLDLFTGTGSIALEFVSRGATRVTAVDVNPRCLAFIRKTAGSWGAGQLQTVRSDIFRFLRKKDVPYDLVFADPPYDLPVINNIPDLVLRSGILKHDGLLVLEHGSRNNFREHPGLTDHRCYGSVNFSFFRVTDLMMNDV